MRKNITVGLAALLLIFTVLALFQWARTIPPRPSDVAPNAVFLWAPNVGLPAAKRGQWLFCWENNGRNRCRLSSIGGATEYEGEFVVQSGGGPVPADQLMIDPEKTREHKVWVGSTLVPVVVLRNGKALTPASE